MGNKFNIIIQQGATFKLHLTLKDSGNVLIDLTGCTARMEIKSNYADLAGAAIVSITETLNSQGQLVLGGAAGTIDILILATHTDTLLAESYFYDLELQTGTDVERIMQGNALVDPQVTT